jgi:hypothetical protein
MKNGKVVLLVAGFIAVFYYMPLVGFVLTAMFIHWKFKELAWRLQMAGMIFLAVLFTGLYLSNGMNQFVAWLAR